MDNWVSPAGQHFIHLVIDDKTLAEKSMQFLSEEIKKYYSMPFENYMQEKPTGLD